MLATGRVCILVCPFRSLGYTFPPLEGQGRSQTCVV
jgi:hypothetical protein